MNRIVNHVNSRIKYFVIVEELIGNGIPVFLVVVDAVETGHV
jgi:hypothetical protein